MNKKATTDIGSGLVWIPVIIIVFIVILIFFIVVIFASKSFSIDLYKNVQDNGIVQYEMLNALMKSKADGKTFEEELNRYIKGEDIDLDLAQIIRDILKRRGNGCYLFSVKSIFERFMIEDGSVQPHGFVQTLRFDEQAIIFDVEGKEGRFYSGKC